MTAPAPWPKAIHPVARNPHLWNRMLDGICEEYRAIQDGDVFLGVYVTVRDGDGRAVLIVRRDGVVRRIPVAGAKLVCERDEEAC